MGAAGLERRRFGLIRKTPVVVMSMNEAEDERLKGEWRKRSGFLPLGVVGEKSFSDPTSDTWKNKEAEL